MARSVRKGTAELARNAVVVVADENVLPPATYLANRLTSLNSRKDTDIILMSDWVAGLEEARRIGLSAILREVDFAELDLGDYCPSKRLPTAAYYPICLPRVLAKNYSRILYLDVDTYPVSARIFDVFTLDLKGCALAASRALFFRRRHLNSGVLLIDVATYREANLEERILNTARSWAGTIPSAGDQAIINRALSGDWLELSPRFNFNIRFTKTELAQVFAPEILHFVGPAKPWADPPTLEHHPARVELAKFLADTAWSDFLNRHRMSTKKLQPAFARLADAGVNLPAFLRFLTTTEFADVAQGLTKPCFERLTTIDP